jgi:serine/threonine protein kinase
MAETNNNPLPVGATVHDRYRILEVVGRGGLGTVYKVVDLVYSSSNVYALKELADQSPGARKQFELESQWLQSLNHTNIPKFREHFEWHGRLYLVMDFVSGENLEQKLARLGGRGIPEQQSVAWILPICDALYYLHTRVPPILHRDLKPANIIVTQSGHPVLVDLGIAKEHLPGAGLTATFVRKAGTEGYAPPEQYTTTGQTGPWSDVYGIGATMYHLLTGCVPPTAVDRVALDAKLIHPRDLTPTLSNQVDAAVCHALALRPAERFHTVLEFSQALMGVGPFTSINSAPRLGPSSQGSLLGQTPAAAPSFPPRSTMPPLSTTPPRGPLSPLAVPLRPLSPAPDSNSWAPQVLPPRDRVPSHQLAHDRRLPAEEESHPGPGTAEGDDQPPQRLVTLPRLLIAIVALVVLLAIGGGLLFLLTSSPPDRSSPGATVTGYYNALSSQDYNRAWQYTADSRNNVGNQSNDIRSLRADDTQFGKVLSATIGTVQDAGSTQATVQVDVKRARGGGTDLTYSVTLTQFDGNTWLIDQLSLQS